MAVALRLAFRDEGAALGIFELSVALAVAAVPEALAAIVTGALAIAMHETGCMWSTCAKGM